MKAINGTAAEQHGALTVVFIGLYPSHRVPTAGATATAQAVSWQDQNGTQAPLTVVFIGLHHLLPRPRRALEPAQQPLLCSLRQLGQHLQMAGLIDQQ